MTIRLTDTLSRQLQPLEPITPGRVGIYVCGPTVQSPPHIGHLRSGVAFDILRRWLLASGYDVTLIRNVTDIDDKILANAQAEGRPWWALASENYRAFDAAYDAVAVLPPTHEPRATGHVPEMVELMQRLIDGGHAYPGAGGDVWFDVRSLPSYGELSGQRPDAMQATETAEAGDKRDPLDFALWKGAKPGEPSWPTPWGPGRPGWHLECSAMATRYLGPAFDIHGGGQDLVFPHHENELAQSGAAGDGFARLWLHHGLVNTGGEKMSKSLGNSLLVPAVLQRVRPAALRYYLGAPQLRSDMDFTEAGLVEAEASYSRIEGFLQRAAEVVGEYDVAAAGRPLREQVPAEFAAAMDDDLAVPRALSVLHAAVRDGNAALSGGDKPAVAARLAEVAAMAEVLGLSPANWAGGGAADERMRAALDRVVPVLLNAREAARARKDFAEADSVRDALADAGITVEDTADGPRWRLG